MWVTKLLISPVKKRIFCPKTTKFGPKLAFLVNLGQVMQALWRAGCISQDTYLLYKVAFLLKFFKSVCSQHGYLFPNISIFFLKAMEIDQLSIMSKLSRSLVIDRSHDEANTISSSASKIDGLFVSLQLELNIRQPTTK